ncbi:MAG: hypothetical protein U0V74_10795 [Chitinophagales bacterium]
MKKLLTLSVVILSLITTKVNAAGSNCCTTSHLEEFKNKYTTNILAQTDEPAMLEVIVTTNEKTEGNAKNLKETFRREIIGKITCPDFVTENSEANDVKAIVSVNGSGRITVFEIYSGNEELKQYAAQQLQNMKLTSTGDNEKFVLVIKFRVV